MKKYIFKYCILLLVTITPFYSCATIEDPSKLPSGSVEEINGQFFIEFHTPAYWDIETKDLDIELQFYPLGGRVEPYIFNAKLINKRNHQISFNIDPSNEGNDMKDGYYLLRGVGPDKKKFRERLYVNITNRSVSFVSLCPELYTDAEDDGEVKGSGTADDPYLLSTKNDFRNFIYFLHDDPSSGRDLYFKQTADIWLDGSEGIVDENGWISEDFSGYYNGGGFTIGNIYYLGGDSNIGLFRNVSSATIENLTVDILSISSTGDQIGAIAGRASYTTVRNCKVTGRIDQGHNSVGGVFGSVGVGVAIDNVDISIIINNCNDYVGGVIGQVEKYQSCRISNITTNQHIFEVRGHDYVGGILGYAPYADINISNVSIVHTVNAAADLCFIEGNSYVGGILGYFENIYTAEGGYPDIEYLGIMSKIENSYVNTVIKGHGEHIGGIVGRIVDPSELKYQEFKFTSVHGNSAVTGGKNVGGFIGSATNCRLYFENCSVQPKGSSIMYVKGEEAVGGFIGDGLYCFSQLSNIKISTNVTASGAFAGGFAGKLDNAFLTLNLSDFTFSNSCIIEAGSDAGGFAGYLTGGTSLRGNSSIEFQNPTNTIPKEKEKADFTVEVKGSLRTGGVVGFLNGATINNVHFRGQVTGGNETGGIVGYGRGSIYNSMSSGKVVGANETGGIIGKADGAKVCHTINYASVDGKVNTGGTAGYAGYYNPSLPYLEYCVNVGSVKGNATVGGNIGLIKIGQDNVALIAKYCANFGSVTCNDGSADVKAFGGVLGCSSEAGSWIYGCANHGDVTGNLSAHGGGGIVGSMGKDPTGGLDSKDANNYVIEMCVNTGDISNSNGSCHLGGIVGYAEEGDDGYSRDAAIFGCLNTGDITSNQSSSSAGIAGYIDWYCQLEYCSSIPNLSNGISIWYGDCKKEDGIIEGNRVQNNVKYESSSDFSVLFPSNTDYQFWVWGSGTYPLVKDCPFQSATYN